MKTQPITIYNPSFGIYKEYKKTSYGDYIQGTYKNYKIEIFNAHKYNQKLQYVSDNKTSTWIKSKLIYFQNNIKKIVRSKAKWL